jgi:hypothetical protein
MQRNLGRNSALALGVVLALSGPQASLAASCVLASYGEFRVTQGEQGRSLMPVLVDGRPLLASFRLENRETESRAGLAESLGDQVFGGRSGEPDQEIANLGSIRLGTLTVPNAGAVVTHAKIDGDLALGRDVLGLADLELDLGHGIVRLYSPKHCAGNVAYWASEHLELPYRDGHYGPSFEASINGHLVRAALAPSAAVTTVDPDLFDSLGVSRHDGRVDLDSLEFGGIRLHHIAAETLALQPLDGDFGARLSPNAVAEKPGVLIGADVLKQLRLFIAQRDKTIYFTVGNG